MENTLNMDFLERLAKGLSEQFGKNCEIAIHDLTTPNKESTLTIIENGHVTNRSVGDGPSQVVLEALKQHKGTKDQVNYSMTTEDGRILRSSTIYMKDEEEEIKGIFSINYDVTELVMAENTIHQLINRREPESDDPKKITRNVESLLDELIEQSVKLVGKPVALMSKADKKKAMQFLNEAGAFLITKSGDKISEYFGISKYTIYNYIDVNGSKG
ncbi:MAG: helix-turn-helix transcriptional regulator [Cellulosilyticaceae bacterium]